MTGREREIRTFDAWLGTLPYRHRIVIAGNHDWMFELEPDKARALLTNATYLEDDETVVEGVRFYGSPWQPEFGNWAFNLPRGDALAKKWARVPAGVDVLVTHGPPMGMLDVTSAGEAVGCEELEKAMERIRPRVHVFGHIHEGYGSKEKEGTVHVNASSCDKWYRAVNEAIVVEVGRRVPSSGGKGKEAAS
jgi:predicted phosphohydrolase